MHILLKSRDAARLSRVLAAAEEPLRRRGPVEVAVDVDPQSLL
jgi:primosomal protein N'